MNRSVTSTEPIFATRPRSLRSRSTIIRFSARCFSSTASQVFRRASSRGVRPRGAVPFIGRRRHVLALAAEEQLGRQREHVELAGADERAIRHALLAPERRIERDRIAVEGEAIFQREIDLIDVARGDVVLHLGEGVDHSRSRVQESSRSEIFERSAAPLRLKPGARAGIVEADGAARKSPSQKQRHAASPGAGA